MALPLPRKPLRQRPVKERRAPPAAPGTLRWLKGLIARPLALERRGGRLHLVLVERRRRPNLGPKIDWLRDELGARLLARGAPGEGSRMPALERVHDALGRQGWRSVEPLPAALLAAARVQASVLLAEARSAPIAQLLERLRVLHVGAELREQRERGALAPASAAELEVRDSTPEEFEALEREWSHTAPPAEPPAKG